MYLGRNRGWVPLIISILYVFNCSSQLQLQDPLRINMINLQINVSLSLFTHFILFFFQFINFVFHPLRWTIGSELPILINEMVTGFSRFFLVYFLARIPTLLCTAVYMDFRIFVVYSENMMLQFFKRLFYNLIQESLVDF